MDKLLTGKSYIHTMKTGFYIENPCTQSTAEMTPCGRNFHCRTCNKQVADLSSLPLAQVNHFAHTNEHTCVILHKRHQQNANWFYRSVNRVETRLWNLGLKKTALICTLVLLTASGCYSKRKRKQVTMGFFRSEYHKEISPSSAENVNH
ncbi:MAG: hypothetical protein ACHQF2_00520 [Flavobacteriales bacterium]